MVDVTPPPFVHLPNKFKNDEEIAIYFDHLNRMLLQLWQRTGGNRDYVENNELAQDNQSKIASLHAEISALKGNLRDIQGLTQPNLLGDVYTRLESLENSQKTAQLGSVLSRLDDLESEIMPIVLYSESSGGGSSGVFVPNSISGGSQLSTGASGAILTVTPPSGERAVLVSLLCQGAGSESGITISVGGTNIISAGQLAGSAISSGQFIISSGVSSEHTTTESAYITPPIIGGVDEAIVVTKDTGSTSNFISYSTMTGTIK